MSVFDELAGQPEVVRELTAAAVAARRRARGESLTGAEAAAMTHAWLFTGPPGSGRSVAARCLAAALQCTDPENIGCGHCAGCQTALAGTHADVHISVPDGLSLGVDSVRRLVERAESSPHTGDWQVIIIEDADRLTEQAGNTLLKAVEEPARRTVFALCAPSTDPEDIMVTLRSRSRHVYVRTPSTAAVADLLHRRDGLTREDAQWAASVSSGHIGRARRLVTDEAARERRTRVLALGSAAVAPGAGYALADDLVRAAKDEAKAMNAEVSEPETHDLERALGAGGTGKGAQASLRGARGALSQLENKQKSREKRMLRDALDLALIDLASLYRDALAVAFQAPVAPIHVDKQTVVARLAEVPPECLLQCIDAVLNCRDQIGRNVKPEMAVAALVARLGDAIGRGRSAVQGKIFPPSSYPLQ